MPQAIQLNIQYSIPKPTSTADTHRIQHVFTNLATNSPEIQETGMVLLVDDDRIFLEITRAMLSMLGFTVLIAMDGLEAVEVFRQYKDEIRLVLSDVAMPRMNGWETLFALRQIMPGIPVILASGYSEEQVMKETHLERPQAFLGKPFGLLALRDSIRQTLGERRDE